MENQEPKCPKCNNGTLSLLSEQRKKQLNIVALSEKVLGCDECSYWIEEELL